MADGPVPEGVRVDKWLWIARFVKNRTRAVDLVGGGHVQVNGRRVKPGLQVKPGDALQITIGEAVHRIEVLRVDGRRGPAAQAQALYHESDEDRAERERLAAERRAQRALDAMGRPEASGARPTKRDRRRIEALRGERRGRR